MVVLAFGVARWICLTRAFVAPTAPARNAERRVSQQETRMVILNGDPTLVGMESCLPTGQSLLDAVIGSGNYVPKCTDANGSDAPEHVSEVARETGSHSPLRQVREHAGRLGGFKREFKYLWARATVWWWEKETNPAARRDDKGELDFQVSFLG